jgi:hypothetical protein
MGEKQKILVFQREGSGEGKVKGIKEYGEDLFDIEVISIDMPLPEIIEDSSEFLPADIEADLVLDFLNHPDLSQDLSSICCDKKIPIIASGKKIRDDWSLKPPT